MRDNDKVRKIDYRSLITDYRDEVSDKGINIGEYIPDLIAFSKIIVDTKVIEKITDLEIGQMINYLKITGLKVGLIINFKRPKLEWKRVVL